MLLKLLEETQDVFAPSSAWEGWRSGVLVPVGDDRALANAILATRDSPLDVDTLRRRADDFRSDRILQQFLELLCDLGCRVHP